MPKGRVPERDVVCRACGVAFRSDKVGKAAFFCRTAACDAARGVKPGPANPRPAKTRRKSTAKPELASRPPVALKEPGALEREQRRIREMKEREAREAAEREALRRVRIEAQRREARERRAAMNLRERRADARMQDRQRTMFDPILDDYKSMLLLDEFMETIQRATELDGSRSEVKKAIVKLANAAGAEARWEAAVDLAAAAMALAGATPRTRIAGPRS